VSRLSVFIDESGDFGFDDPRGYYVLSLVFHRQSEPITSEVDQLRTSLAHLGITDEQAVHSGALIRGEEEHRYEPIDRRKYVFARLFAFARHCPISFQSFVFRKSSFSGREQLRNQIAQELESFFFEHRVVFARFTTVIIYYDFGQKEISDIITTVFRKAFSNVEFRKVEPKDYRLFQVADLCCTMELLKTKDQDSSLSRSDLYFFGNPRNLRRDFLKQIEKMRFNGKL